MDLYKLITLILVMNLGLSMGWVFYDENKSWQDFLGLSTADRIIDSGRFIEQKFTNEDEMTVEQSIDRTEYNGGIAATILAIPIMFATIFVRCVYGSIITLMGILAHSYTTGNTMLSVIGWAMATYIGTLYIWLGMKAWTWFHSKDTQ